MRRIGETLTRWGWAALVAGSACAADDNGSAASKDATGSGTSTTATESSGGSAADSTPGGTTAGGTTPGGDSDGSSSGAGPGSTAGNTDTDASTSGPVPGNGASLQFAVNGALGDDYAELLDLPAEFGVSEFTFEIWAQPDDSLPVGPTGGSSLENWSNADPVPYMPDSWWFDGNFLLDGHHNGGWDDGSFDLQLYAEGRVRWLFGDGELRGVQAQQTSDAASLLDGLWHHIATVRRADGFGARLELWVDGQLIGTDGRPQMVDMRQYWDDWPGFGEPGWFLGAEKGSAVGGNYWDDYKGLVAEARFWSVARSEDDLTNAWAASVTGDEPGLVGWFQFGEGGGNRACDSLAPARCWTLFPTEGPIWSEQGPPLE